MSALTPQELKNSEQFDLLAEIEHNKVKRFIIEQINFELKLIRWYSTYQILMIVLFISLLIRAISMHNRGMDEPFLFIVYAVIFSFTILVIVHEFSHAVAYWFTGAKNLKAGAIWKKFIFYVVADKQVIDYSSFKLVALAPLVMIKLLSLVLSVWFWKTNSVYFFLSIMCIHSLFCAGDVAMLAFYKTHADKEIYNYDDVSEGKTYFYYRK